MIAYGVFWDDSESEQTLPDHPPQQQRPVYQPPPRPPPPSQSYRSSPYTPLVHQPEQHRPVYQPPLSPSLPPPSQSYRSSPYAPPVHQHQPDDNQEDQPNEYYLVLRARANKEGDEMERCFNESREVHSRGDRAAAKDLSKQGKNHKQKMEQLNKEASDCIYLENNRDCRPGEIDLHRLRVKEAIARTDAALEEAKLRGDSEIRIIVGKGLHSEGGAAKVRPAIKGLMRKYKLVAEFDPSNSGVLVVELNGCPPIRHHHDLNISDRRSSGRTRRASNIGV
ncbi:hypothetical protein EV421DRAFT_1716245 [Armillaria borealis]|uniref:Smr domain-containing protein n=1 Tax=Armillaria borealis TaxID=47425 RepID=A0AA39MIV7_9AGAR|nr:hypothetical protein EV421DRAFT_1716245 [Armillaria borealis]